MPSQPLDSPIQAALTLAAASDLDGAERLLQDHLAHHPRAFAAYIGLGQIYRRRRRRDLALSALARAFELKPDHETLPDELALELFELGRWSEALAIWEERTQGSNPPRKALQDYANALLRIGRLEEAEQRFNTLIKAHPHFLPGYAGLLRLAQLRFDWQAVLSYSGILLSHYPPGTPAVCNAARERVLALVRLHRDREAEQFIAHHPGLSPSDRFKLSIELLLRQGRSTVALGRLRVHASWVKADAELYERYLFLMTRSGCTEQLVPAVHYALRHFPLNEALVRRCLRALESAGKPEVAARWLRR